MSATMRRGAVGDRLRKRAGALDNEQSVGLAGDGMVNRAMDEAEDRYAFAGRDETETDPHITAANERWFGPDVEAVTAPSRSPETWLLHSD